MSGGGRYSAAVTFAGRDEIAGHLRDNVWETAKAVLEERPPDVVQDKLLDHVSQRFRFSHVLGRAAPPRPAAGPDDDLDDFEETDDDEAPAVRAADPATTELVRSAVQAVRAVVAGERAGLSVRRAPGDDDRTDEEIIEDELENRVRRSAVCERIVETLLAEIAARFDLLEAGDLHRDGDGWPVSWTWDSGDRAEFLRVVTRFSSNRTALFGRLLTPLVDGIRVRGPFRPLWAEREARLVLIDGEGLGHIPGSVAAVSTRLRRRLDEVDAIVLVDNAQQPMQAAPVAVMRTAAATGNGEKLHFLFTHFDLVTGDNLHTVGDRKRHVLASAENVLNEIREELGIAERVLRRRLDEARHFVGGIERALAPDRPDPRPKAAARTMRELNALLDALAADPVPVETGPSRPVYRTADLTEAVAEAARGFHGQWRATLGLAHDPRWPKRHWASVKALTRRLAEGHTDEYQDLRPAASLRTMLEDAVYRMLQRPVRWTGPEPDVEDQEVVVGDVASALTRRLIGLVDRLVTEEPRPVWKRAYEQHGKGSTIRRAHIVIDGIYAEAVPFPTNKAAYENRFSDAVAAAFKEAAAELDLALE
ncbi:hypothetical protein [Actinomadura verrucosospora]|uniref:Uncharacterized protein n=1 Tax=Actinomadura verrucosospora TaxID=46165 RepID=A0A7D3VQK5_ACTVE|nr:hypothetical protein [Actinomadura verrucosospora]QKG20515.1 hypothetical protein ACTIVE_2153 [Actinomadura verrucosospora]